MSTSKSIWLGLAAGWIATMLAIVVVAILAVQPEHRSSFFWYRVIWSIFLTLLLWSSSGAFFLQPSASGNNHHSVAGVLPSLAVVVSSYAIVSFGLMLVFMTLSTGDVPNRFHMILQVCVGTGMCVVCVFLSLAKASASHGLARMPEGIEPTASLVARLEEQEQRLNSMGAVARPCMAEVKALREVIRYSLPSTGAVPTSERYRAFSRRVAETCIGISALSKDSQGPIGECVEQLAALRRDARAIADELKRR